MKERPSLHSLELFVAVVERGTMTAAAEALGVSQPTISVQIRNLEGYFGTPLLERRGRRVYPTAIGVEVAAFTRRVLETIDQLDHVVAEYRGLTRGRLLLGASATVTETWLLDMLAVFQERFPGIDVDLRVGNSQEVLCKIRTFEVGLGIVGHEPDDPLLRGVPVYRDALWLFTAPGHPKLEVVDVSVSDLEGERFVVREIGSATRELALRCLAAWEGMPAKMLELASNDAVKRAVRAGLGIGVLSARTLSLEIENDVVGVLAPADWRCERFFWLVERADHQRSPGEGAFAEFLCAAHAEVEAALAG